MPEDERAAQPQPFQIDFDKFVFEVNQLRASYRVVLDDLKTSLDMASSSNKQLSAFFERLLLIDLGTVGLSVTALTSFASKLDLTAFRKYAILFIVSCGWVLLLRSAFLCRAVMLQCVMANKSLLTRWEKATSDYHLQAISISTARIRRTVSGTLQVGETAVDMSSFLSELTDLSDPLTLQEAVTQFRAAINEDKNANLSKGVDAIAAMRTMQIGLVLLGIAAIMIFA